jgi:hypothetical protein
VIWEYVGDNGFEDVKLEVDGSGAVFICEEGNRGDPIGEDGGGEEGVEAHSIAKEVGELVDAGIHSVSRSDDVTRAIALLIISVVSSSVNRSRENTL